MHRTARWVQAVTKGSLWKWKVVLLTLALSLFFAPPRMDFLWSRLAEEAGDVSGKNPKAADDCWDPLDLKINHPFANSAAFYSSDENWAKRTFRIVPALAAHVLHLGKPGYFLLQVLAGVVQIRLLVGWFHRLTRGRVTALLLTLGMSFTYYGQAAFFDSIGWGDPVAYLLLTLAVTTRNPLLCAAGIFLGGFTDERALPAGGFAILTHLGAPATSGAAGIIAASRKFLAALFRSPFTLAVLGAWAAYFAARYALGLMMDYTQPYGLIGWPVLWRFDTLHHLHPGLLFTLKLTILPLLWLYVRRVSTWTVEAWLGLAGIVVSLILSFAVLDHVRSLAYLGPAVLFALQTFLSRHRSPRNRLRPLLGLVAAGNLLWPTTLWVLDDEKGSPEHSLVLQRPLPVEAAWLIGKLSR